MIRQLVTICAAILAAGAAPAPSTDDNYIEQPLSEKVKYHYRYGVTSPDHGLYTHSWEERLGNYVKGAYSLMEPDGKIRTVDYEVDGPKGFHAVIRTSLPGNSYLSFQQLSKSRSDHRDPPVNILTNKTLKTPPTLAPRTPKRLVHKDLPPNFHSDKPDYFWGSLPHDHFSAGKHSQQPFHGTSKTGDQTLSASIPTRVHNSGDRISDAMTPPARNAPITNYADLLRAGAITDVVFTS